MNVIHAFRLFAVTALLVLMTTACSDGGSEAATSAKPAKPAVDQTALNQAKSGFESFLKQENHEMAERMGDSILKNFAGTPEAKAIEQQMPEIREKAAAAKEVKRLQNLWVYQKHAKDKGDQWTAQIKSAPDSQLSDNKTIELILRVHPEWGHSVYMLLPRVMKSCKNRCKLDLIIDEKPSKWKAFISGPKDPPAVFIEDYNGFIDAIQKAKVVKVQLNDGLGMAKYEVGGFQISKHTDSRE